MASSLGSSQSSNPWVSRAVLRLVEVGSVIRCNGCGEQIKYRARGAKPKKVVCNIYRRGKWQRVEHYHPECFTEHGPRITITESKLPTNNNRMVGQRRRGSADA